MVLTTLLLWDIRLHTHSANTWSLSSLSRKAMGASSRTPPINAENKLTLESGDAIVSEIKAGSDFSIGPEPSGGSEQQYECGSELRPEPRPEPAVASGGSGWKFKHRSWAEQFIRKDLKHWEKGGISHADITRLSKHTDVGQLLGHADAFRFQIVDGRLYIDFAILMKLPANHNISEPPAWFPSSVGPGNMASNGRAPLAILALYELLWMYPGQVPDVDAAMHFADLPLVMLAKVKHAPPLFSACSSDENADAPFPDFSFWGNMGFNQQRTWQGESSDPLMQRAQGWTHQRDYLLHANFLSPLATRTPALFYRGRAQNFKGDDKRRAVVGCAETAPEELRHMFNTQAVYYKELDKVVHMDKMCSYRYLIYIESYGWSASLKHRLACGSVLFQVKATYHDWFSRGLVPGTHYVEAPAEPLEAICPAILKHMLAFESAGFSKATNVSNSVNDAAVKNDSHAVMQSTTTATTANNITANATASPSANASESVSDSSPSDVSEPSLSRKHESRRLQGGESMNYSGRGGEDGSHQRLLSEMAGKDSVLNGSAMGRAQTEFVQKQLRMQDVREYMLDLLGAYAELQRFVPAPSATAQLITAEVVLKHFLFEEDRASILAAYPWLHCQLARGL